MPIRPELKALYPPDWTALSRQVRFERAGGICQQCGRPHGQILQVLPGGRWKHPETGYWFNKRGRPVAPPDLIALLQTRQTKVVLAAAHLNHDPTVNRMRNLRALCQRFHLLHDRVYHLAQWRLTFRRRLAIGDFFEGMYHFGIEASKL